jgi:uncharacterized protein YaaN involved in tellurite resistance
MNYQQQPDPNQVPQQAASAVQAAPQAEQAGNAAVENYDVARWNEMTPEEQKKVMELAAQINVTDSQSVISFGAAAQQELARFSDTILDQIRNKDAGTVGESLTELLGRVQELDAGSLDPSKNSGLSKLFGGFRAEARKFVNRYDKMSTSIEKIIDSLEKSKVQLIRDITMLDVMYVKNLEHLKQLDIFIMAGTLKLQELNGKVLPALREQAARTGDSLDAQKVKDAMDLINRFEKKIHDLKLTRMIAIQTAPQIRLIQSNDQMLVERIQSSILNTIPLWKNQIVISITLLRQQDALKLQKSVTDSTNELLAKNSELLKTGSIQVAKENERGIVELETLKKVNTDLVATLQETLKIQSEGRTKRMQVESELKVMENDLKARLMEMTR